MEGFEKFTKVGSSFSPKMTIRKGGYLGLSQGAANKYGIQGEGRYAVFFYNKERNIIGIKITADSAEEGAVKIQWRDQGSGPVIQCSIRSFLDYYGIDYSESISYVPEDDKEHGVILLHLNSPKDSKARIQKKETAPATTTLVPENTGGKGPF